MSFWKWLSSLFNPQPPAPPPPTPKYDIEVIERLGIKSYPKEILGLNGARAMKSSLKEGVYWYQAGLELFDSFSVFRNGGTVTFGSRFDLSYPGNGYAKSKGTWPAIFSLHRRLELVDVPDISEFVQASELITDSREPVNYHVLIKEAMISEGFKILYVANPYQDAQELTSIINYFGSSNFVGIVAGNELNSPKAYRFGIRAEDVVYWASTLRPVCQSFGIPLGVGLPPYEYMDNLIKGVPLNKKLQADRVFAEVIAQNASQFDFACIHPYGQVPQKDKTQPIDEYIAVASKLMPNDYDFVQVQVEHFQSLTGLPLWLDEHGLENPEFGHANTLWSARWHRERVMTLIRLSQNYNILGSCFQVLLAETFEGRPISFIYGDGGFQEGCEIQAMSIEPHGVSEVVRIKPIQGFQFVMNGPDMLYINESGSDLSVNAESVIYTYIEPSESRMFQSLIGDVVPNNTWGEIKGI